MSTSANFLVKYIENTYYNIYHNFHIYPQIIVSQQALLEMKPYN